MIVILWLVEYVDLGKQFYILLWIYIHIYEVSLNWWFVWVEDDWTYQNLCSYDDDEDSSKVGKVMLL